MDQHGKALRRYEAVLKSLDLWDSFSRMPRGCQVGFVLWKCPEPVLEFDKSFPTDDRHRKLRRVIEQNVRRAMVPLDIEISLRDFYTVIIGLKLAVEQGRKQDDVPEPARAFMEAAWPYLQYYFEQMPATFGPLHKAVVLPLIANSAMDLRTLTARCRMQLSASRKNVLTITLASEPARMQAVELDGKRRPMFQVATGNDWDEVRWLNWTAQQMGRPDSGRKYPVYVQRHALENMHRRIDLPRMAPYLEYWLYHSLAEAKVVPWAGGRLAKMRRGRGAGGGAAERNAGGEDLLVEYRLQGDRLGYLVVTPLENAVAVRTFLFLTMQGTPESRKLYRLLRLERGDVEVLELDKLSVFTQTDLRNDKKLRKKLEACGCGHLFTLGESDYEPEARPFAAKMRRYLGMSPPRPSPDQIQAEQAQQPPDRKAA